MDTDEGFTLEEGIYIKSFETSPAPTLYVFSGKIKLANKAAVKFFEEFGIGELEGADFKRVWPGGTASSGRNAISDLEKLKPGKYELTLPNGRELVAGVTAIGKTPQGNGIVTINVAAGHESGERTFDVNREMKGGPAKTVGYGTLIIQDERVKQIDPEVAGMCGYCVEEVMDTPFYNYLEPAEMPKVIDNYKRRMDGEYVTPIYETVIVHKTGRKIYVDVNATLIRYRGKFADFVFVRDITERKRADSVLARERDAFYFMAEASARHATIPDLCRSLLSWFMEVMDFDSGFIRLYDGETGFLYPTIAAGLSGKETKVLMRPQSIDDPVSTAAFVAKARRAVFAPDLSVYEAREPSAPGIKEFGSGALICWTVSGSDGELLAVLQLNADTPKDVSEEDRKLFETVLEMFGTVLERKYVEEALTDSERVYRNLYESALAMSEETRSEDVCRVAADRVGKLLDVADTAVYLTDIERGVLVPVYSNDVKNREAILAYEIPINKGLSGRVAETGTGAFINIGDRDGYAVHVPGTDEAEDENESIISVPMFDGNDVLGVISATKIGDVFGGDDLTRLAAFAREAEIAIKRARDLDSLRESLDPLRESLGPVSEGEEGFRVIFETAEDPIFIKDAELKYTKVNPASKAFFGVPASGVVGRTDQDVFGEVPALGLKEADYRVLSGETVEEEVEGPVSDVTPTFHVIKVPVRDENDVVSGICGIARDVTKRKEEEERLKKSLKEKEVLLKETHHRVKNNLQIISSLLSLQAGYVKDEKLLDILRDSQKRIRSMALIHEKFYQAEDYIGADFSGYVHDLILSLFSAYRFDTSAVDLQTNIADVFLDMDTSIPLALIINELISNSLEHAFPDERKGRIRVDLKEEDGGRFKLTVEDDGVGLPEDFDIQSTETLGLRLVAALVEQLGGKIEIDTTSGTRFDITFSRKRRAES
jgi:PAS domain S-box-containing protein